MPTYTRLPRFDRDFAALTAEERRQFAKAVGNFIADLKAGGGFWKGPRVKGVQGSRGVYEMTSIRDGDPHVIWRRVGKHRVLGSA